MATPERTALRRSDGDAQLQLTPIVTSHTGPLGALVLMIALPLVIYLVKCAQLPLRTQVLRTCHCALPAWNITLYISCAWHALLSMRSRSGSANAYVAPPFDKIGTCVLASAVELERLPAHMPH